MKKIIFALIIICIAGTTATASDTFSKRLKICTAYKTTYKNASGKNLEKAVMGVTTDPNTLMQSCIYYIQTNPNGYKLCKIPVETLNREGVNYSKAKCSSTNSGGIEKARKEMGMNSYVLQKTIINHF